jgi:DNA modification methylase
MKTEKLSDTITIINADCYTLLDAWPSDAAIVTDPPYGISLPTNYAATRRAAEARDTRRHAWPCQGE